VPLESNSSSRAYCLNCKAAALRPLVVLALEGYPPADSRHNIVYAHDAIFVCGRCGAGYAEQRRHDCFDFEDVWNQDEVCPIAAEDIARLHECLASCPDPVQQTCSCAVHESLRASWSAVPVSAWGARHLSIESSGGLPRIH
jgi:hypothetical protein